MLFTLAALAYPGAAVYLRWPLLLVHAYGVVALIVALVGAYWIIEVRRDTRTRIVHGLEHATLRVLEGVAPGAGGRSLTDRFIVNLQRDTDVELWRFRVDDAARIAIARVQAGETELAYSELCSTRRCVSDVLLGVALTASGVFTLFGVSTAVAILGLFLAVQLWRCCEHALGILAQRWFTVTAAFKSAEVVNVFVGEGDDGALQMVVQLDVVPRTCVQSELRAAGQPTD